MFVVSIFFRYSSLFDSAFLSWQVNNCADRKKLPTEWNYHLSNGKTTKYDTRNKNEEHVIKFYEKSIANSKRQSIWGFLHSILLFVLFSCMRRGSKHVRLKRHTLRISDQLNRISLFFRKLTQKEKQNWYFQTFFVLCALFLSKKLIHVGLEKKHSNRSTKPKLNYFSLVDKNSCYLDTCELVSLILLCSSQRNIFYYYTEKYSLSIRSMYEWVSRVCLLIFLLFFISIAFILY